jgi:hypothetical protein
MSKQQANTSATTEEVTVASQNPTILSTVLGSGSGARRNDSFGSWRGNCWTVNTTFNAIGSNCQGDSVTVMLGSGNYFVQVNGPRGYKYTDEYHIIIDPAPPPSIEGTLAHSSNWRYFDYLNTTMLARGLDPDVKYTLTFTVGQFASNLYSLGETRDDPVRLSSITLFKRCERCLCLLTSALAHPTLPALPSARQRVSHRRLHQQARRARSLALVIESGLLLEAFW